MSQHFEVSDLWKYEKFAKLFTRKDFLGDGGDGVVHAYEHSSSKALVAVKMPHKSEFTRQPSAVTRRFEIEMNNLQILQQHEHIAGMLAWSDSFPVAPAIFLPLCKLGDLSNYVVRWKNQVGKHGKINDRISEVTIWKCLRDMALALHYLHNMDGDSGYTHNDIKPGNILVDLPNGWNMEDGIPDEPVFRLTDFARMTRYDPTKPAQPIRFYGTPEYSPPINERECPRPSADIWALGATLQTLALGVFPTQSREAYSAKRKREGLNAPILIDDRAWMQTYWRCRIPTTYRPLSATQKELINDFDVQESIVVPEFFTDRPWKHRPYSKRLNVWYEWMFAEEPEKRITANTLVKFCVPVIGRKIRLAREEEAAEECFERARRLRERIERQCQDRVMEAEGVTFDMVNVPGEEGKDNHAVEAE